MPPAPDPRRFLPPQDAALARRTRRVIVLLGAIIVLSLADLLITLGHLHSTGMAEANPIAAFLIRSTHSPWILTVYKALTVGICVALLYRLRRHVEGEVAAWCAVVILVVLSLHWHRYSEELGASGLPQVVQGEEPAGWLQLD